MYPVVSGTLEAFKAYHDKAIRVEPAKCSRMLWSESERFVSTHGAKFPVYMVNKANNYGCDAVTRRVEYTESR